MSECLYVLIEQVFSNLLLWRLVIHNESPFVIFGFELHKYPLKMSQKGVKRHYVSHLRFTIKYYIFFSYAYYDKILLFFSF